MIHTIVFVTAFAVSLFFRNTPESRDIVWWKSIFPPRPLWCNNTSRCRAFGELVFTRSLTRNFVSIEMAGSRYVQVYIELTLKKHTLIHEKGRCHGIALSCIKVLRLFPKSFTQCFYHIHSHGVEVVRGFPVPFVACA